MFEGTEDYGDRNDSKKAWAIKFDNMPFKKVKIESVKKQPDPYSKEYTKEEITGKLGIDSLLSDADKIKSMGGANIFISPLEKFRYCPVCKYALCEDCFDKDDFHDILNHDSYKSTVGIGEGSMRLMQKGQFIQIERKGFYFCDKLEVGGNRITLNYTPDGKAKNEPKVGGGDPNKAVNKAEEKKKAAGGADVPLSKKEQDKLDKKNKKAAMKAGGAPAEGSAKPTGGPKTAGGGKPASAPAAQAAQPQAKLEPIDPSSGGVVVSGDATAPKEALAVFDPIEKVLVKA